jgi:iron(III) transport system ATP-binding protein
MIKVDGLSLTYHSTNQQDHLAVDRVSFEVAKGEFYTLLGPSGCGKTTTLRCVAGLEKPDIGEISIDGKTVSSSNTGDWVPPNRRAIGMVFQSYAIWPHMTVFDNVAFPLRYGVERLGASEVSSRVRTALEHVQLHGLEDRPAPHLSGGQQQRLALARALVMEPKVLLLDEPLSNLDAKLRDEMRTELRRIVKSIGITTIFVTHEQIEALTLSDNIAVMNGGRIMQEGPPVEIYRRPVTPFVADFIGQSNLLSGTVSAVSSGDSSKVTVDSSIGQLDCVAPSQVETGDQVILAIRPEHIEPHAPGDERENIFEGVLEAASFIGNAMDCTVRVGDQNLKVLMQPDHMPETGSTVKYSVSASHSLALAADPT